MAQPADFGVEYLQKRIDREIVLAKHMGIIVEAAHEGALVLHHPILLGTAGCERVVAPEAHYRAAQFLPDCTLVELPESKHEPFLETDPIRNVWLERIDRFLTERLALPTDDQSTFRSCVQ